jgi:hypothetical protein
MKIAWNVLVLCDHYDFIEYYKFQLAAVFDGLCISFGSDSRKLKDSILSGWQGRLP